MDLTFIKDGNRYVAEFKAESDFNLHIEKPVGGIWLFQKTSGSKYDTIDDVAYLAGNSVFDYDAQVLIPKFIKIVSEVKPTYASIVSSGEITEIKSQAKSIEITSNGTTSVEPDAGFSYLSKVDVKVDVPMSGGSASSWKYYDVSKLGSNAVYALNIALLAKGSSSETSGTVIFVPQALTANNATDIVVSAIAFDEAVIVVAAGGTTMTFGEAASQTLPQFIQMGATEISESEFYNLES